MSWWRYRREGTRQRWLIISEVSIWLYVAFLGFSMLFLLIGFNILGNDSESDTYNGKRSWRL